MPSLTLATPALQFRNVCCRGCQGTSGCHARMGPSWRAAGHAAQWQYLRIHLVGHQQGAAQDRDRVQSVLLPICVSVHGLYLAMLACP